MKKQINLRLAGIAIVAIIATVVSVTLIYYNLFQKQVSSDLAVSAKLLKDTHLFESPDIDSNEIDLSTDISELRVTWIDADGTVLYDNDVTKDDLTNHLNRPEISQAFATGVGESVRHSDTLNKDTIYYAVLLDNNTVLRVAMEIQSMWSVFLSATPMIFMIILIILAICIALSHLLTKQLLRPIEMMAGNLTNADYKTPYKELEPFSAKIRSQHADVLSAAKARQDFTANVSHELKTPLTAISGYAELLEGDMVPEEKKKHFYGEIRKNAGRLLSLINDIIRLSELDRSEAMAGFEEVDLCEIMDECKEGLAVSAEKNGVSLIINSSATPVRGNREMLKELIENLVQNAIRYNNPGGKVEVITENKDGGVLIVRDNGIGIPALEQERVFERFYRVDKSRSKATGGTGLGLAIVKHIVEIHGATIELDSALGVGTTVKICF